MMLEFRNCDLKPRRAAGVIAWDETAQGRAARMNAIDLIVTVCAVLSPATCEERHLVFNSEVSLRQCVMAAQPYIAQWVGEHPKWTAVKWRCEYPHSNERI
jgi:hypothetical protein